MILAKGFEAAVNIVEIIGAHTKLRRPGPSGRSWRGPCNLHSGDGPNLAVYEGTQSFRCFVCGKGGDVFDYLQLCEESRFEKRFDVLPRLKDWKSTFATRTFSSRRPYSSFPARR